MSKKKKRDVIQVKEVNIEKNATKRGLTGERLAGFLEAMDVAAYVVKIDGMVLCAETNCGYRRESDPRCKECPQFDAEYTIGLLYELKM